ncbi:MAG TPA: thiamine diphosphokinase [Gaiellaceae bacterium]|nr:thiamine diphosphokinase [Gaiellaceae bacterium]
MPAEEGVSNEVVVVVSGGEAPSRAAASAVPAGVTVVAADRGLEHAHALGIEVAVAIGDFDSASTEAVAAAERAGVRIERHPAEKDETDLELALDAAIDLRPARILVLAGRGGRLDHELSSLLLLCSEKYASAQIDALAGEARVHVVRGARVLEGVPGELLTLLPALGAAEGVRTDGLVYPLRGETLDAGSTRGVSNVFADANASVTLERGVLLAVRPGEAK